MSVSICMLGWAGMLVVRGHSMTMSQFLLARNLVMFSRMEGEW